MAINNRYIQVHPDALIEWIWDDQFFFEDEYSIIKDSKNNISSFTFSKNAVQLNNYNKLPQQLYLIDKLVNRYGIVDTDNKLFLQESKYINNQPSKFDKVKIWFPLNYTFPTSTGFYLNIYTLNYENNIKYNLTNYFLDITVAGELFKITNEISTFRLNEKLWGKSITLYVPSVYSEAQERVNNAPKLGTINYNLTNGSLGLSQTSPITIDFRLLTNKSTILNETTYITTPPLITSIPQTPEYNNVSVGIQEASDGDYFIINGLYNNILGDFETFMNTLESSGKRSYILYTITAYEENIPQDAIDIYVYKDFYKQISYRPIFKFTNTTASIRVDMKIINSVDSSVITKSAELAITGNVVTKYGKYVTPINISNAIKPKLYNSKPTTLMLPPQELINSHIKRKIPTTTEVKYIPYPVLTDSYNVIASNVSSKNQSTTFFGYGNLQLLITPFDNIIKIKIAKQVTNDKVEPFVLPVSNSIIQLIFKSSTSELRIPLYLESNEVDLNNGVLIFKISSTEQATLKKIYQLNKSFYITLTTNGIETSIYDGKFILLEQTPRVLSNIEEIITPKFIPNLNLSNTSLSNTNLSIPGNLTSKPVIKTTDNIVKQIIDTELSLTQFKRML